MFEVVWGIGLLALFGAFWSWQRWSSFRGRLTAAEIDRLTGAIASQVPLPPGEQRPWLERLRAWAEADEGRPVYIVNLMRFHPELHPFPGAPSFEGTPEEANALYEKAIAPLVLKHRGVPVVVGETQGANLIGYDRALDDWSRAAVVGYPSRRDFLSLLADPAYGPLTPYKTMSLAHLLVPISGRLVVPDLRLLAGAALLVLFLAVGWWRAAVGS